MNLSDATQHIGKRLAMLTNTNYPEMKVVVLLHNGNNDISMVSNFIEPKHIFEVLTRGMASCFDPTPRDDFKRVCHKFLETIQPTMSSLDDDSSGVVCFWDDNIRAAAMISSLQDYSIAFAIICEHMYRTVANNITHIPENYLLH